MALQFVLGCAGSGKSTYVFQKICSEAAKNPRKRYYVIVPEQFTLETQKTLVQTSKGKGIMNIDVLSFNRLAYRIFESRPACQKTIMEDMGKIMVVQKVMNENKDKLRYFVKGLRNPGFLDEVKSFLCELLLYRIQEEDLQKMIDACEPDSLLEHKLQDIQLIFHEFKGKCAGEYQMAEEILPQLTRLVPEASELAHSVFCFDGFTGFTPVQNELMEALLRVTDRIYVTLTMDQNPKRSRLFQMSQDTLNHFAKVCLEIGCSIEEPIWTGRGKKHTSYRFEENSNLDLLEQKLFAFSGVATEKADGSIRIHSAKTPIQEVQHVASEIFRMVSQEGYRYGDIAVVCGDLNSYQQLIEREFHAMGIRYFLDSKKEIGANGLSEYLLAFLDMIRRDMDYESVLHFMRGGLSDFTIEDTDVFENYVLACGKRGITSYGEEWTYNYDERRQIDFETINRCRAHLSDLMARTVPLMRKEATSVEDFTRCLYSVMVDENLFGRLRLLADEFEEKEQTLLAKEYRNIYPVMIHLFEQMVALLGTEPCTLSEYIDLISAGISQGLVGFVPPSMDQVVVGDLERSRLKDIQVLFFMGVNDGVVPGGTKAPGILSMYEREIFKDNDLMLAPMGQDELMAKQFYLYFNMTKGAKTLWITYSSMSLEGASMSPAFVVGQVQKMFPAIQTEETPEDHWRTSLYASNHGKEYLLCHLQQCAKEDMGANQEFWEIYRHYTKVAPDRLETWVNNVLPKDQEKPLPDELVTLLYGKELQGSVTRLERYAACPFSHFVQYGLRLKPRVQYEIGNPDFGNVFHEALEHFAHTMNEEKKDWHHIAEEDMAKLAEQSVAAAVSEYRGKMFEKSRRTNYMIKRMERILGRTVSAIGEQMRQGDFEQKGYEVSFSRISHLDETRVPLENGTMQLQGRIDRIDTYETKDNVYVRVVDYKTGMKQVDLTSIYHGLQMQLVVYLEAAMALEQREHPEKKVEPAGLFYYRIKDPMIEFYDDSEEERHALLMKELRMEGYVNHDDQVVEHTDHNMAGEPSEVARKTSIVVPMQTTAKGVFDRYTKSLHGEQIRALIKHNKQNMVQIGNAIMHGEKEISPYRMGTDSPCRYCDYGEVCGFTKGVGNCHYRNLMKMEKDTIVPGGEK